MPRRYHFFFAAALVLTGILAIASWIAYTELGRTPGELIRHAERRLQGHENLEFFALPLLSSLRAWLHEPGIHDRPLPFAVPALEPNPALARKMFRTSQSTQATAPHTNQSAAETGRTIRVGPTRDIISIGMAATLAKDGDVIEIDAGDYLADVAIWDRAALTIRGMGNRVRLIAAGADAEGKAIWVIRRGKVTVENIDFIGARVADRNGAGIRFESGHLVIRNCLFFNNENGLLATGGDAELEIENSEFAYNGAGDGQTHNLYAGNIKSLKVTGSYFHHANVGHLIKSRAARNYIAYNRLSDEAGGRASYELEFPNGGIAHVVGNIIQQTARGSNSTLIYYGAEGYVWPLNSLQLVHNTLVNDEAYGGAFLRVMPGAQHVRTQNNLLIGNGKFHTPRIRESSGDIRADWRIFAAAVRYDYRLNGEGQQSATVPAVVEAGDLAPHSEYAHPRQIKTLSTAPVFAGAIQTPGQ